MKRIRTLFDYKFEKQKEDEMIESEQHDDRTMAVDTIADDEKVDQAGDCDSNVSSDNENATVPKKKPKLKLFQRSWSNKWVWMQKGDNGMICTICCKHKKQNAFTNEGCTNYRTSTLKRHVLSLDHAEAVRAESLQKHYAQAAQEAVKRSSADTSVLAAMRTVFMMAREDIPIKKYSSMLDLQMQQGCEALKNLSVGQNATYMSRSAGEEFQESVADAIHETLVTKIRNADMYSVLVDESTDIAVCKQMVVYMRIVDDSFVPHTYLLQNITIDNPKSDAAVLFGAIEKCLQDEGLNLSKVKGFGSDGASVMVGRHHGVATRMKAKSPHCIGIHCMAHRFNLATSQATKNIQYMKDFEKTLSDLYYYFGGSKSGNRKCELEAIQKVLDDPQVKIKECHEIRWIAFFEAVSAVYKSWNSLVTYFNRHHDKSSKSFREKLTDLKFVSVLHIFMDILPSVAQISMVLQKQDVDVSAVKPALDGLKDRIKTAKKGRAHYQDELQSKLVRKKDREDKTKEITYKGQSLNFGESIKKTTKEIEEVRTTFCDNLTKNISDRFPSEAVNVASAFHVLGMRPLTLLSEKDREEYGNKEFNILINHFGNEAKCDDCVSPPLVDEIKCLEEWHLAKRVALEQMYPRDNMKILWKLMFDYHKDVLPNLIILANLCLIMPYQTADCERGFSCQNIIKTARRNRLKSRHLNILMTIKCEGGDLKGHDFSKALKIWKKKKERRLFRQ